MTMPTASAAPIIKTSFSTLIHATARIPLAQTNAINNPTETIIAEARPMPPKLALWTMIPSPSICS